MGKGKERNYTIAKAVRVKDIVYGALIDIRDFLMVEDDSQHSLDSFEELADANALIHLAYDKKGSPIGYLIEIERGDSGISLVESIYVLQKYRGRGVARAFLAQLARPKNFLYVATINNSARLLYEYLGYTAVSIAPRYMGIARYSDAEVSLAANVSSDAILMANYPATEEGFGVEVTFD